MYNLTSSHQAIIMIMIYPDSIIHYSILRIKVIERTQSHICVWHVISRSYTLAFEYYRFFYLLVTSSDQELFLMIFFLFHISPQQITDIWIMIIFDKILFFAKLVDHFQALKLCNLWICRHFDLISYIN